MSVRARARMCVCVCVCVCARARSYTQPRAQTRGDVRLRLTIINESRGLNTQN